MSKVVDAALALFFPQRLCCHSCGCMLIAGEELLCVSCRAALASRNFKRKDERILFKGEQVLAAAAFRYDGMAGNLRAA